MRWILMILMALPCLKVNAQLKVGTVKYVMPSPMQMIMLNKKAGAPYDALLCNTSDRANNYSEPTRQALALGTYHTDLNYQVLYEKHDQSMLYMNNCRALADRLEVPTYDADMMSRFAMNLANKDSLMMITQENMHHTDAWLQENNKGHYSDMLRIGAWIEGVYILAANTDEQPMEMLDERLAEQRPPCKYAIEMMRAYEKTAFEAALLTELETLMELLMETSVRRKNKKAKTAKDGVTVLQTSVEVKVTPKQREAIIKQVKKLREMVVVP